MKNDLERMRVVDEPFVNDIGLTLFCLFFPEEQCSEFELDLKHRFCALDVSPIRFNEFRVRIPPPEYMRPFPQDVSALDVEIDDVTHEPKYYVCSFTSGTRMCDRTFVSYKLMIAHMQFEHGMANFLRVLIVSNACLMCNSTFRNRQGVVEHLGRSIRTKTCRADRSATKYRHFSPEVRKCRICVKVFKHFELLQRHLRTHLPVQLKPFHLELDSYVNLFGN